MITMEAIRQISHKVSLENGISDDDLSEDISGIVYRVDVFECGDTPMIDRHIDIEYSFGDYYEVREDKPLFQFICKLYGLPISQEESEVVLYQSNE